MYPTISGFPGRCWRVHPGYVLLQQSVCRNTSACRSIVPPSLEHCGSSELQRLDQGDRGVSQRLHDALRNRNSSIRHQIHVSHHRWFPRSLMEASSRIHEYDAMTSTKKKTTQSAGQARCTGSLKLRFHMMGEVSQRTPDSTFSGAMQSVRTLWCVLVGSTNIGRKNHVLAAQHSLLPAPVVSSVADGGFLQDTGITTKRMLHHICMQFLTKPCTDSRASLGR